MARADFARVTKRFGAVTALDEFTLGVADGELVTVLGPSGCGKSTLLRLTAGLERLSSGSIRLDGRPVEDLEPGARDVAMVFQSYALYPHMTVRQNVEFPLRMRRVPAAERRRHAEEVAALLELGELLDRRPAALSGGQRQRVALARALVRRPALFLLDEPLSNVDARLRGALRHYIRDLQRRVAVTTLYVTHDQTEAMTLGSRMVVMHGGRIQQVDAPAAVYDRPANAFVAGFVGSAPMNLLPGEIVDGRVHVAGSTLPAGVAASGPVLVGVRAEAFVATDSADGADEGAFLAVPDPRTREVVGGETIVAADAGSERVTVRLFGHAPIPARVGAPASALHFFDARTGDRIGP
jgi:ABC-type sugar transport system ATPase subunit